MASHFKTPARSSSDVPVIHIPSLETLQGLQVQELEQLLPAYIASRRWYRSKTRTIRSAIVEDLLAVPEIRSVVTVVRIEYEHGGDDTYIIAVHFAVGAEGNTPVAGAEIVGTYRTGDGQEGVLVDALSDERCRRWLLEAITGKVPLKQGKGEWVATRTSAFEGEANFDLPSSVSRAEQSNTSVIFGDRYILKLFRKIEPGVNPDIEIGAFLTEHGFRNTPAVLASLQYQPPAGTEPYSVCILQDFVRNQGDAWKYTLESLGDFFNQAVKRKAGPPALSSEHPLEAGIIPQELQPLFGTYLDSARLLGRRTAEMHTALANPDSGPWFAPEPFTEADGEALYREMLEQSNTTFQMLRAKANTLPEYARLDAKRLLEPEPAVSGRFSFLRNRKIDADRIRFHGDYHLGQVLYTGSDFMIIDFEGEPARPLSERRSKGLAVRDVAGMVRSFQYAAYAALFGQVPGFTVQPDRVAAVEAWAAFWFVSVSAAYLEAYLGSAQGKRFVPAEASERRILLDAFLLQKALYEVAYELNNRPDWVRIPLRGILGLLQ